MSTKKTIIQLLFLLFVVSAFSVRTFADDYQITFTGTGAPAPTDFSYVAGTGFTSDIVVTWNGVTYDFTAADLNEFTMPSCSGAGTAPGAQAFEALTGPCAGLGPGAGGTPLLQWSGAESVCLSSCADNGIFVFLGAGTYEYEYLSVEANTPATPGVNEGGGYTTTLVSTPTPEPGTFGLLFSGLLGFGLLVGMKRLL